MPAALITALFFTVALLVTTAYFLLGSVPLLVLKHDTPLDARFVRGFFNTYYLGAMVTAGAAAVSYAVAGNPGFAAGAAAPAKRSPDAPVDAFTGAADDASFAPAPLLFPASASTSDGSICE